MAGRAHDHRLYINGPGSNDHSPESVNLLEWQAPPPRAPAMTMITMPRVVRMRMISARDPTVLESEEESKGRAGQVSAGISSRKHSLKTRNCFAFQHLQ